MRSQGKSGPTHQYMDEGLSSSLNASYYHHTFVGIMQPLLPDIIISYILLLNVGCVKGGTIAIVSVAKQRGSVVCLTYRNDPRKLSLETPFLRAYTHSYCTCWKWNPKTFR